MGKRNLKKEKAERNKAYARQYRKTKTHFNSKFSRRSFNSSSANDQNANDDKDQGSSQ
jgi:hypothetical protein